MNAEESRPLEKATREAKARENKTPEKKTDRPRWMPHRAKDGVFETHFSMDARATSFAKFVEKAIKWSDDAFLDANEASLPKEVPTDNFRVLDTFFGEAMNESMLVQVMEKANDECPFHVLLVNPWSDFGMSRAESMKADPITACRNGLRTLFKALDRAVADESAKTDFPSQAEIDKADETALATWLHRFGDAVPMQLKFYSVVPSGPLYIFRDLALCGRYCYGRSTTKLPWSMVVDDPHCYLDLYDQLSAEFQRIWEKGMEFPIKSTTVLPRFEGDGYMVFLSHSSKDKELAQEIHDELEGRGIETFMDARDINPGEKWSDEIREKLNQATELVVLITNNSKDSRWVQAEMGAFWALAKTITPAVLEDAYLKSLPEFVRENQAVKVATIDGRQNLYNAIATRAGKPPEERVKTPEEATKGPEESSKEPKSSDQEVA